MEVELQEIRDFLAQVPPFDRLPETELNQLPRQLRQGYTRRGQPFPPNAQPGLYLIRQGAVEQRDSDGNLMQQLAEGEYLLHGCQGDEDYECHTLEDSLYLVLDCTHLQRLQQGYPEFLAFFQQNRLERLQQAMHQLQTISTTTQDLFRHRIADFPLAPPLSVAPNTTIQQSARQMNEAQCSFLLIVEQGQLLGIITDSDLRKRVVAQNHPLDAPIEAVMTPDPITVEQGQAAFEAVLLMSRKGIQHLPVMTAGVLQGVLTAQGLMQSESRHDYYLISQIRRADSPEALAEVCRALPELQRQLMDSGATAQQLSQVLAQLSDTLTRRLLKLAQENLGDAPVVWTWIACGSQARQEQTMTSDQDSALLLGDDYDAGRHGDYFYQLTRYVSDGLHSCGFKYCPGEAMALNSQWRQSVDKWQELFKDWIQRPEPQSVRYAANFFDMRRIAGDKALLPRLQNYILPLVSNNNIFLAHMAALAGKNRPPLGFFRDFVLIGEGEHARELDLKLGGLLPVTDMARVFALAAGSTAQNTRERLQAAVSAQRLSDGRVQALLEAYTLVADLRARHQARQVRLGESLDNYLDPAELGTLERNHLKDAFRIIKEMQEYMGHHYQSGMFG